MMFCHYDTETLVFRCLGSMCILDVCWECKHIKFAEPQQTFDERDYLCGPALEVLRAIRPWLLKQVVGLSLPEYLEKAGLRDGRL